MIDPWQRIESLAQRLVDDSPDVNRAQDDIPTLLLYVPQPFTQKDKLSILFTKWNQHVVEQLVDRLPDGLKPGWRRDFQMHQTGHITYRDRKIPNDLENRHAFGDLLM